jgi:GNAT superfamily N-acetyltransferase
LSIEFAEFEHQRGLPQQRELFENAFPENSGGSAASVEHYQWKFHGFPASPSSYEYEAAEDGRMLGYYAAIPYGYEVGGRRLRAGMVCDVMTHSDARGRGVFTELGRFSLARMRDMDLDFVTGYPIRPEVMGGHIRVGWRVAFELPMYLKPLRANAILTSKGVPWLAPVANLGISIAQTLLAARRTASEYRGAEGAPRELFHSASFERFLEVWSTEVPNHLVKSAEFYDWRLGAPGTEYRAFLVQRGEQVVAAAVGRVADLHGIPSLALLDLMALKGHERALSVLYRDIEQAARRRGVEAIVTMMSKPRAREYRLLRFGFLKSPFVFKLIVRSLNDQVDVERLSQVGDWHLMWIDSDDL